LKGGRQEGGGHESKRSGNVKEWGGAVRGGWNKGNEEAERHSKTSAHAPPGKTVRLWYKSGKTSAHVPHSKTSAHVAPGKTGAHVPQSKWKRAVASVKKFTALSTMSSNKKSVLLFQENTCDHLVKKLPNTEVETKVTKCFV